MDKLPTNTKEEQVLLYNWAHATNPSTEQTMRVYRWLKARLELLQHVAEQEIGKKSPTDSQEPLFTFVGGQWPDVKGV